MNTKSDIKSVLQRVSEKVSRSRKVKATLGSFLLLALVVSSVPVFGSSHREAPLITSDPKADATDMYAFVSPDNSSTVTLIANYVPFQEPNGGPNFYPFDDSVLYEIKVDHNADAVEDITYQFRFRSVQQNPDTFLYNTGPITDVNDADWNLKQLYTVTRIDNGVSTVLGTDIPTPPANIGPKSTPDYPSLQAQAVRDLAGGVKVFAGQSDDPFFADLGGLFDLLTIRKLPGNQGGGVDGLRGYNVNSIAIQVPIDQLTSSKTRPTATADAAAIIGTWTTASRQSTTVLGSTVSNSGPFVQVSRLGAPLVNEVVIPVSKKDLWNRSQPANDAQFANFVTNPELGKLLKGLYNINVPPQGAFGTPEQRDDLVAIFLTGLPNLTKPANVKPSEQLRLNVAVAPTANPNRFGVLGGDNQGYPNGRRLADDVTDISIRAVAGAAYPLFHPEFTPDPTGVQLGDGVDANEKSFRGSFPYLALPTSGFNSVPHSNNPADDQGSIAVPTPSTGNIPLYRLYNARANNHFYTSNASERDYAINSLGYRSEGSLGNVSANQVSGSSPLYRLYSARWNNHFYTTSAAEKDAAIRSGFRLDGVVGYVADSGNSAIYRFYNPSNGDHFYTNNESEGRNANGYVAEGITGYLY